MAQAGVQPVFPGRLLEWAGHRTGGVRRLFHDASGRPAGEVIPTPLLARLSEWVEGIGTGRPGVPRIVLLVGGPGNGKTEAVEEALGRLDHVIGAERRLVSHLATAFAPAPGHEVPRKVSVNLTTLLPDPPLVSLTIVQDASVSDSSRTNWTPARLLVEDLTVALAGRHGEVYVACVNRGILDEALVSATTAGNKSAVGVLEATVQAVGVTSSDEPCWPLKGYPDVAVWPMDVESLLLPGTDATRRSPAEMILEVALEPQSWPQYGACPAGESCPFCLSRETLSEKSTRSSLLLLLRHYELATGKRWTFRDLFTLASYALAGSTPEGKSPQSPCEWARQLCELESRASVAPSIRLRVPFVLVGALYQHALFGRWPRLSRRGFRQDLKELKLEDEPALLGLYYFLSQGRGLSVPATLQPQLAAMSDALDPALADPDVDVELSGSTTVKLRDIDARFSHSIAEGLQFIRKHRSLSKPEVDLLQRLAKADATLSDVNIRRNRPVVADRVQALIRDFACRLVRRSLGVRRAVLKDSSTIQDFAQVADGEPHLLHEAAKQVGALLNGEHGFEVTLNTTFGEPQPPLQRRAVLTTSKQKLKPRGGEAEGRPRSNLPFLVLGSGQRVQSIPLTYELFRSVRQLQRGMLPASLPNTVVALLDTARARLAGAIVRDSEALDGATIRIGTRNETIVQELGRFLVRQEGTHEP